MVECGLETRSMNRRRLLLACLVGALTLVSVAVLLIWLSRTAITPANVARIEKGMTLAEVEALLAGAPRNETDLPDNFINDAFVHADPEQLKRGRLLHAQPPLEERRWASHGLVVSVIFDASGRVVQYKEFTFDVKESWKDKLRRWLRM